MTEQRNATKHDSLADKCLNIFERQKMAFFQYFTKGTACLQNLSPSEVIFANDMITSLPNLE